MIDWVGIILCVGAMACLVMGIDFGGVQWSWGSGSSIALFVVAGVLFIAFGVQQTFLIFCTTETRLFPIHFLKRKSLVVLFALNSRSPFIPDCNVCKADRNVQQVVPVVAFLFQCITYLYFSNLQRLEKFTLKLHSGYLTSSKGDTAVHASVRLLPFVLVLIFVIILNGHMMTKLGYYLPWYLLGGAFELVGAALMCKFCLQI